MEHHDVTRMLEETLKVGTVLGTAKQYVRDYDENFLFELQANIPVLYQRTREMAARTYSTGNFAVYPEHGRVIIDVDQMLSDVYKALMRYIPSSRYGESIKVTIMETLQDLRRTLRLFLDQPGMAELMSERAPF